MPGKDKLEYDIIANDKASTPMDKIAKAGKTAGSTLKSAFDKSVSGLKNLTKGAKDTEGSLQKLGGAGKEGLGKLAEGFKAGPLAFLGIGAGLGAAVLDGFSQAMEKQDATALLGAQLGASNAEMGKLGKISGDLYKNAFGESVQEVDGVLKTVFQSGLAAVGDAEDSIKGVTEQVMNYAKISGEEALPITRAVAQMLKTGLAKNATEAFDLLTRGTQKGIDKSEDMLDTMNEYGTQFRKLGLQGPQAFGLISQAIQAGARDSDVAADAIKEFSIRAVDGSATTVQGFKELGLSAKGMQAQIAGGGAGAAKGLDTVLDRLRAVKSPAQQAAIATMLFGTQAEDLGKALYAMDLTTAASDFGTVAGAAQRAGDVINDTASNKLTTLKRSIQTSIIDAIGKYALPKLEEFADWFNGPGKMVIAGWAIGAAEQFLTFADGLLNGLEKVIPALVSFGVAALRVGAASTAIVNPKLSRQLNQMAGDLSAWGPAAVEGIGTARDELETWKTSLASAKTKVELTANIEDLDQKLATAQAELRDPGLTKTRRAVLNADITQLTAKKDQALRQLNDPNLIKTRTAQLTAQKQDLDAKLAAAKRQLADPKLTATKRAKLEATISQLLRQKATAQNAINGLTGKTVIIDAQVRLNSANIRQKVQNQLDRLGLEGRETGGRVKKGTAYVVGEKRAELFQPDEDGTIIPNVPPRVGAGAGVSSYGGGSSGGGGMLTLNFEDSETGRFMMMMMRKAISNSGSGGNVQLALGGKAV